ncbi:YdeI/OmpD-associated family protein [Microlunatus speluncae]|uniref:YdeI/OmpD-associated family protein n=1 Tax=Microlunatus speluncae TaxID=2594267 RepID=UPI00126685C4|nr:YdeI/OmpD-associated family protein [Microlunatus speluncae]
MKFRAELESSGKNTAGFEVPDSIVEGLGGGGHPKVVVKIKGYEFRTSIAKMGGRYMLGVSADRRGEAGVAAGDVLDVEVELDTAERVIEVPDDFAEALAAEPAAKEFFESLSYSKQSWHTLQITGAKKPETRDKRVASSVAMLREGRAR